MNIVALILCSLIALVCGVASVLLAAMIFTRGIGVVVRILLLFLLSIACIGAYGYGYDVPSRLPVSDYTVLIQEPLRVETLESNGHVSVTATYVVSDVFDDGNTSSSSTLDTCRAVDTDIAKSAHMNPKNVRIKVLVRKNIYGGFAPHKRSLVVLTDNELKKVADIKVVDIVPEK